MESRQIRLQRNVLVGVLTLSVVINLLLAIKVNLQESMVILVPTIDRELRVGSNFVSEDYLKLRAEQVIYLFFSMREGTVQYVTQELLKHIDGQSFEEFKKQLEKLGNDIKDRGYRYLFTDLQSFEIDAENLTVTVAGYLETYLGESQINKKFKKYMLSFTNRGGIVKLKAFAEIKEDEKAN